jgi:uncharacterized BrkB/YihY/UPF0761 family membrane protein
VDSPPPSRRQALADRVASARGRAEAMPGGPVVFEAYETERDLGGGLIAGGVAFRIFLWLVPFGLVVAALLSLWSEQDEQGLEEASRELGIGAAAAEAATEALQTSGRDVWFVLGFGLVTAAWFTLGAVRALVLAHALAWQLKPPKISRPFRAIAIFNGLFVLHVGSGVTIAWLREHLGTFSLLGTAVTLTASTAIVLTAMWLLPRRATHVRELLPGALLVAVGVQLIQVAVVYYFAPRLGRSEETYGALGAAATILVWLYAISRLITGAAFLNSTLWLRRNEVTAASPGSERQNLDTVATPER